MIIKRNVNHHYTVWSYPEKGLGGKKVISINRCKALLNQQDRVFDFPNNQHGQLIKVIKNIKFENYLLILHRK